MNRQSLDVTAGEDRTLTLYARDAANDVLDLTGYTIAWRVGRSPTNPRSDVPLFTKTGTVTGAAAGTFTVPVANADTVDRQGDYWHEAWATSGGASILVTSGRFRVRSGLEAA